MGKVILGLDIGTTGISCVVLDMKNEVVTYVTDVFGRIVAVMCDGDLNKGGEDEGADESKFYALTDAVSRDGRTYTIAVATEDGEDELTFAKGAGNDFWVDEML